MKRILIVLMAVVFFASCQNENKIKLSGEIKNADQKLVKLSVLNVGHSDLVDSLRIQDGKEFKFTIHTEQPDYYILDIDDKQYTLFLEPGEKVVFYADMDNYKDFSISGSEGSSKIQILNNNMKTAQFKIDSLISIYQENAGSKDFESIKTEVNKSFSKIYINHRRELINFIIANQNSLISIYPLYLQYKSGTYVLNDNSDINYVKLVVENLNKNYPNHIQTKALQNELKELQNRFQQKLIIDLANEANIEILAVPEILLPDLNGNIQKLSANKGKPILLYFWAAWNKQSIAYNPELIKIYNKYHAKGFEVYAVSLDNNKEVWEKAIRFDNLTWINVSDLKYPESYYASLYNIKSLPASFLISKDFEIVGNNVNMTDLEKYLKRELK